MLYFLLGLLTGVIIGLVIMFVVIRIKTSTGAIQIDTHGEKDIYRIVIDKFDNLNKSKRVWLRVKRDVILDDETHE